VSVTPDNTPAFPINELNQTTGDICAQHFGMTLRDYFAAKAMTIIWDAYDKGYCGVVNNNEFDNTALAKGAYAIADAMLEARK